MTGLNWNQNTALFKDTHQMFIPNYTLVQLFAEFINKVEYLADFDKPLMDQVDNNLQRPGGRVPEPNPGVAQRSMIPTPLSFLVKIKKAYDISWRHHTLPLCLWLHEHC